MDFAMTIKIALEDWNDEILIKPLSNLFTRMFRNL